MPRCGHSGFASSSRNHCGRSVVMPGHGGDHLPGDLHIVDRPHQQREPEDFTFSQSFVDEIARGEVQPVGVELLGSLNQIVDVWFHAPVFLSRLMDASQYALQSGIAFLDSAMTSFWKLMIAVSVAGRLASASCRFNSGTISAPHLTSMKTRFPVEWSRGLRRAAGSFRR